MTSPLNTNSRYRIRPWIGQGGGKHYSLERRRWFWWETVLGLVSSPEEAKTYMQHLESGRCL